VKAEDVLGWWAPDDASWVEWVKPVAFACMSERVECRPLTRRAEWFAAELLAPLGDLSQTAVVVDLRSTEAIWVGLALAEHGVRPIPLYNAVDHDAALVNMRPIMAALVDATQSGAVLSAHAPPAFLLDSERMDTRVVGSARLAYDNRWVCRAVDFPSSALLMERGVRRVLLIQEQLVRPAEDLEPILLTWQAAGLPLWRLARSQAEPATPFNLAVSAWPVRLLRWLTRTSIRRRRDGSYGRMLAQGG
jgi:hypothetical protein